jgi:hypothetical protein
MMNHVIFSINLGLKYAQGLCQDIPDNDFAGQPVAGATMNHPAWVIGHLAVSNDFGCAVLGKPITACPPEWTPLFTIGSKPLPDRSLYPSKEALLAALAKSTENLNVALQQATPEKLASPSPEQLKAWFPTVGDFVLYDLTTHAGTHLGQLSAWRRAKGMPSLF